VSHEQGKPHKASHETPLGFTDDEKLYYRVSNERFQVILTDEQTTVHRVSLDTNNYGEFLFVMVSRPAGDRRQTATFYSLGLHEYRERWIIDHWHYYEWNPPTGAQMLAEILTKEETEERIQQRRDEIAQYGTPDVQTRRGKLFDFIADITDDDFAVTEIDDLEDLFGDEF
jgi:hypothetical protein